MTALKGSEAMEAVQRDLLTRYVGIWCDAFTPHAAHLPPDELNLRCIGILGAGDAISLELLRGRIDESRAAASLAALITAAPPARVVMRRHLPKNEASPAKVLGKEPLSEGERMRIGYLK
jgi:hypothetical protein